MPRVSLIIVLLLCATVSFAQSKKKKKGKAQTSQQQSSSLAPYYPEKEYAPKQEKSKKRSNKATYTAEDKFYDRRDAVAKAQRKAEKEQLKPQYSDPTYFGHKRKPKKRPPHKMKFCKECEIRH